MSMKRISVKESAPNGYKAMLVLDDYTSEAKIEPRIRELIKIRASQINGCAYCIDMHTKDSRSLGESERRIYALSAWRESPLFDDKERAMLAATDEMTNISFSGLTEETYVNLSKYFDARTIADLILLNVTINAWNRIAVSTHLKFDE